MHPPSLQAGRGGLCWRGSRSWFGSSAALRATAWALPVTAASLVVPHSPAWAPRTPCPSAQTLALSRETCSASPAVLRAAVEMDKEFPSVFSACLILLWASTITLSCTSVILLLRAAWPFRCPSTFVMPAGTTRLSPSHPFLPLAPRASVVRSKLWPGMLVPFTFQAGQEGLRIGEHGFPM